MVNALYGPQFGDATPYVLEMGLIGLAISLTNLLVQVFMAIRDNGFIPILVVGCIAEGGLIVFNHAGIQQVVIDVLISLLVLLAVLTARGYLLLRRPTADPFARAEQVQI